MPKITIYVRDDLYAELQETDVEQSRICQEALRAELHRVKELQAGTDVHEQSPFGMLLDQYERHQRTRQHENNATARKYRLRAEDFCHWLQTGKSDPRVLRFPPKRSSKFEVNDLLQGHFSDHLTGRIHFDNIGSVGGKTLYSITAGGVEYARVIGYDVVKDQIRTLLDDGAFPQEILDAYDKALV